MNNNNMFESFFNPEGFEVKYFENNGTDTEEFFQKNKKKFGREWYYYDKTIEYKYNEQGFRNKSFKEVSWENSIVFFGCSNVLGTGHLLEDTLTYRLEKKLGIPVVNMGISGGGIDIACWNSLILHDHYPRPKAIVQMWSALNRYTDKVDGIGNFDVWHPRKRRYCGRHAWDLRSKLYTKADRALWKDKTIYYECSMFKHTAKELKIDLYDQIDYARDLNHPGIESFSVAVNGISEKLIEQGILK